jgi:hypothetical protein
MANQSILPSRRHRSTLVRLGLATLLATLIASGLLLWTAAPATAPTVPMAIPAQPADRQVANRSFADEIAGAVAPDLTNAASGTQPEWDVVQPQVGAPVIMEPQSLNAANRFFADEISAGAGVAEWTLADVPAMLPQHGPR